MAKKKSKTRDVRTPSVEDMLPEAKPRNLKERALAAIAEEDREREQRRAERRPRGTSSVRVVQHDPEETIPFADFLQLCVDVTDDPRWRVYQRWAVGEPGGREVRIRKHDRDDDEDRWVVLLCSRGSERAGTDQGGTARNPVDYDEALRLAHRSYASQLRQAERRASGEPAPWER